MLNAAAGERKQKQADLKQAAVYKRQGISLPVCIQFVIDFLENEDYFKAAFRVIYKLPSSELPGFFKPSETLCILT